MIKKKFELSQSALKDWENFTDKNEWKKKWIDGIRPYEFNTAFIYGSLLDGFLFEPEVLSKRFISYSGKCRPSDSLQNIIGYVAKTYDSKKDLNQQLLEASRKLNFGNNWKDDTIIARFAEQEDYIQFCISNKYKTVVMKDFAKQIKDIANYLVNHTDNDIYNFIVANPSEDYRNEFQVTLRGEINGVPFKIILDILHYDEINSTVRIIDFKTTYDTSKFTESIDKYGYNTQLSIYQEILKQNPEIYEGYTLIEPMNVVVAKKDLDIYVHNYFNEELKFVKYGDQFRKGWLHIVDEISSYLQELENEDKRSKA